MKKLTGKQWKEFYNDPQYWGPDSWFEEENMTINGNPIPDDNLSDADSLNTMKDTDIVCINGGVVYLSNNFNDTVSLESHITQWKKTKNTTLILIEVKKELEKDIKQSIKNLGGKILV